MIKPEKLLTTTMQDSRHVNMYLKGLMCVAVLALFIADCQEGLVSEFESFFSFIRAIDPNNVLRIGSIGSELNPCLNRLKGVNCNLQATTILELRFENKNLSGTIDADSLCKLQNLRVLSLANNFIRGTIPSSISNCRSLTYLNLSSNLLSGRIPAAITELPNLRTLDTSNNQLDYGMKTVNSRNAEGPGDSKPHSGDQNVLKNFIKFIPLVIGVIFFSLLTYFVNKNAVRLAKEKEILRALGKSPSPLIIPVMKAKAIEEVIIKPEEQQSELVFFVEENERFKLEDLLESAADLQSQSFCSSLYKVILKNNAVYAVKRLKKLQASFREFGETMRRIGNLKHPNILPLVGYNSSNEEKLLIYKYQTNGSLLTLFENYIDGRRDFPWRLRLSIASGIARGLDFLYQKSDDRDRECIPHGNIKLTNILLNEKEEPLISEYGFSRFLDSKKACFQLNGYTAPEKTFSEQGDVFSFGVILLELLTGKTVERSGIDLPKWVKSMVREEWTGEVFDKEVQKAGHQWAFPLLNISLKCVSQAPEDRPTVAEVLEKIEEAMKAPDDNINCVSPASSNECHPPDCCILHSVISETWDTPGSNC